MKTTNSSEQLLQYTNEDLVNYPQEFIEKVQKVREEELKKCIDDFSYFARRWLRITHPEKGLIPFRLYEYQERMILDYEQHRFNIISKFRQGGATTTTVLWCLWRCLFKCDQRILVVSIGDKEAIGSGKIVRTAIESLPDWMQPNLTKNNDHEKEFADTNSFILFYNPNSARSMSLTYLIVDEAAFIERMDTLWGAMLPALSAGGNCVIISTVNGRGNWYEETYHRAVEKQNHFHVIDIDYTEHPEYKKPGFAEMMKANLGEKKWLQEFERSFLGTGETYIDSGTLSELSQSTLYDEPIRRIWSEWDSLKEQNRPEYLPNDAYVGGAMWIWQEPEENKEYMLAADVAEGRGENNDYSAFHIIDVIACEQVAEFYSNLVPPHIFAQIISQMGLYYNTATVIVENIGIGISVVNRLQHSLFYENLYYSDNDKAGFKTVSNNRPVVLESLQYALNSKILKIHSRRLVRELDTFIYNTGKRRAEATKGKHDDLVMAMAMALYVRDERIRRIPIGIDHQDHTANEPFETDLYERIKKSILENAPRDFLSLDEELDRFKDEEQVTPGVMFNVRREFDSLKKEFGF